MRWPSLVDLQSVDKTEPRTKDLGKRLRKTTNIKHRKVALFGIGTYIIEKTQDTKENHLIT